MLVRKERKRLPARGEVEHKKIILELDHRITFLFQLFRFQEKIAVAAKVLSLKTGSP